MKTFSVTPKASITKQLTLLSLIGFASFVVMVVALHVLRPDYNPTSRVISEYAIGPYSPLMTEWGFRPPQAARFSICAVRRMRL